MEDRLQKKLRNGDGLTIADRLDIIGLIIENERLRGRIFRAAHQIALRDHEEAYHELYQAVDPCFEIQGDPFERWRKHADALLATEEK